MGRFLSTAQWQRVRLMVLERDGWVCQIRLPKCTRRAEQVDHIISWRDGGSKFDPSNLRAACAYCNNARGRVKSVTAPPSREW